MLTVEEVVTAFRALSRSEQKTFLRVVSPRGPIGSKREVVFQAVVAYLDELTTINGKVYDDWLLNLRLEELEALGCYPMLDDLKRLENLLVEKKLATYLTEEELRQTVPKNKLSLISWIWIPEGWKVFTRDGKDRFYEWATQQTEKLIKFKKLQMKGLLENVVQRLGREKRKHTAKGNVLRWVHEAKDEFFLGKRFKWGNIPRAFHHKRQRFQGDPFMFYRHREYFHLDIQKEITKSVKTLSDGAYIDTALFSSYRGKQYSHLDIE